MLLQYIAGREPTVKRPARSHSPLPFWYHGATLTIEAPGPPAYTAAHVKRSASSADTFEMFREAADDALGFGLDGDEVREIMGRIETFQFLKSIPTRRRYPHTQSDYYIAFIEECGTRMFIKFLIHEGTLVVTSFKEDDHGDYR